MGWEFRIKPLMELKANHIHPIDILLSRSYSEDMNIDEVRDIYKKLYDLHPISKEMIQYTSHLISQNDDIKIYFGKGFNSAYYGNNIIKIDSDFKDQSIFNIESVVIHELGHYIYNKLFDSFSLPFDTDFVEKLFTKIFDENKKLEKDVYKANIFTIEKIQEKIGELNGDEYQKHIKILKEYDIASKAPIKQAAKYLKADISECDQYQYSQEIAKCFKDNSYIVFERKALKAFVYKELDVNNI